MGDRSTRRTGMVGVAAAAVDGKHGSRGRTPAGQMSRPIQKRGESDASYRERLYRWHDKVSTLFVQR